MLSDDELTGLDEFALLAENAEQAGVNGPLPEVERVQAGAISALRWGGSAPRVIFLHGGGQNAHTWDTVIVGLGEPALAVDLPGHGHSAWREDGNYSPQLNSETLAPVLRELAPGAEFVVGMSLGGLTAIRLAAMAPDLVGELVLVDVTPSALQRHAELTAEQRGTVALMHGEREFPSFQAMLDLTIAAAPHRDVKSLRRGVFHNSRRLDNGNWVWRYDAIRTFGDFAGLWDDVDALSAPITLVRGGSSGFVTDQDTAELHRRATHFRGVHIVEKSGHSVQSDQPRALIEEDIGVDIAFTWDHFFPLYGDPDGPHFECWTVLGAWAEQTSHIEIGALVTCNSYRNPELLADMARTVDHISGGRLILGIGSGWKQKDYDEYGYRFGTAGSRLDDLAAALPRIKARLGKLNPPPTRDIPVLIGGGGERKTLRLVAEYADIWHSFTAGDSYLAKSAVLSTHCSTVGRNPATIERSAAVDGGGLIASAEALAGLGVTLLTVGCDGPDYDLSAAAALCRWRDGR